MSVTKFHIHTKQRAKLLLASNIKIKLPRTVTFRAALCGCDTWSVVLWEEHEARVLENVVLRKVFVPGREELAGGWS